MVQASRRKLIKGAAAAVGTLAVAPQLLAQAGPVRVGYAMSRTGPWTGGAQVSQEPNYLLWAEQQNAAGGISVKGVKRQIELISSDDRSDTETVVRTYEKLMGSDKVDLVLPPWGSNANFAVAPLANRRGDPFLAPTARSRRLVEMKLPYFFLMLQQPKPMMDALVDMLKANGAKTVAVIYVDDLFGLENYAALKVALADRGSAPTLVFDEIDTGVGGAVADAIGQRLKRLSDKVQVLSVTHAPQVAARASSHFLISKGPTGDAGDKIATRVAIMEPEHRKEEIARMLAGASVTDEARAAAAQLLAAGR